MQKLRCAVCRRLKTRDAFAVAARVNGGIRLGMNPLEAVIGGRTTLVERRGNVCVACYADLRRCTCGRMARIGIAPSARGTFCEICARVGAVAACAACSGADAHYTDRQSTSPIPGIDRRSIFNSGDRVFDVLPVPPLDPHRTYFGIEMEFEINGDYDHDTVANEIVDLAGLRAFVKDDASLSFGIECVSVPLELDDARAYLRDVLTEDFWAYVDAEASRDNAGMHVHVSRCAVGRRGTARALLFLHSNANMGLVNDLAGRDLETYGSNGHEFAALAPIDITIAVENGRSLERRRALNVRNVTTLEFRMFVAPMSLDRALVSLEAAAAIIAFSMTDAPAAALTHPGPFLAFIAAAHQQYPALAAHLERGDHVARLRERESARAIAIDVDPSLVA